MMSKPIKLLLIWMALFLIAGLIFQFRAIIISTVIEPIALVIWTFWNLIGSIDQRICWSGVIILCLMITLRLIPSSPANLQNPAYSYEFCPQNQFDFWQMRFGSGNDDRLRSELKDLLLKVMAESNLCQASDPVEVKLSKTTLSTEAQKYLLTPRRKRPVVLISLWQWLKNFLSSISRRQGSSNHTRKTDIILEIVQWMETELDIKYEKYD